MFSKISKKSMPLQSIVGFAYEQVLVEHLHCFILNSNKKPTCGIDKPATINYFPGF